MPRVEESRRHRRHPGPAYQLESIDRDLAQHGFRAREPHGFLAIVGISWFWLYGALLLAQFRSMRGMSWGGNEALVTLMLSIFTVGIGAGSMLCEKFSGRHVEIGLIPIGAIGLTLFGADLAMGSPPTAMPANAPLPLAALLATGNCWRVLLDLFAIGFFGGFFVVPLYVLMQSRSAPELRARIIAANNILNALFMVAGALAAGALLGLGVSILSCSGSQRLFIHTFVSFKIKYYSVRRKFNLGDACISRRERIRQNLLLFF